MDDDVGKTEWRDESRMIDAVKVYLELRKCGMI